MEQTSPSCGDFIEHHVTLERRTTDSAMMQQMVRQSSDADDRMLNGGPIGGSIDPNPKFF
jgi:hypothetical protein